jgi:hypothetical protein
MFYNHEDPQFKIIVDNFILSSTNNDQQLSYAIKNIDHIATKIGISFYQMMFLLIQQNSDKKRRKNNC